MTRLENAALKSKCRFLTASVVYLGHQIDAQGLPLIADRVRAVQEAPTPQNVTELNPTWDFYVLRKVPTPPLYQLGTTVHPPVSPSPIAVVTGSRKSV